MDRQFVELHFSELPRCNYPLIKSRAEEILSDEIDSPDSPNAEDSFLLFHRNHCVRLVDAEIPVQTAILAAHKPIDLKNYEGEIQQSWGFHECEAALKPSQHTLLITEMMSDSLPPKDRVRLLHGVLQAVIEITQPEALVFKHSQQLVHPEAYLAAISKDPILRPGALNVRFFTISNSDGDMLMDTRKGQKVSGTKFTNSWSSSGSSRDFQAKSPCRLGEP